MPSPTAHQSTLRISQPIWPVVLWAAVTLVILGAAAELLARSEQVASRLLPPSLNGEPGIATRIESLDRLVARSGKPDCFFIGNSMIHRGINPPMVDQAFTAVSGQPLHCFNFGLRAANAVAAMRIAAYLVREYHPRVLIYGTSFRDLVDTDQNLDIPWMRFQEGDWNPEGWLETHSYAYREVVTYRAVLREGRRGRTMRAINDDLSSAEGFRPAAKAADLAGINRVGSKDYVRWSRDYAIDPQQIAALDALAGLQSPALRVVILEMPLSPGIYDRLPNGMRTHDAFTGAVGRHAARRGVDFWPTLGLLTVPDNGWSDQFHLNTTGANFLSRYIGERLAARPGLPAE